MSYMLPTIGLINVAHAYTIYFRPTGHDIIGGIG